MGDAVKPKRAMIQPNPPSTIMMMTSLMLLRME